MANESPDSQMRLASEGLSKIEQVAVYRDTSFLSPANSAILQMNQSQRDFVETELVRSGILPEMSMQILGNETLTSRIDVDKNGELSRAEIDNDLLRASRKPADSRNFVEEMTLSQIAQRNLLRPIRLDALSDLQSQLRTMNGYEQALREYDGLSKKIAQRYPNQHNPENNRFEISAAERALEDDAKNSFLNPGERTALNFMIANRDDLYKTRLGIGTLFGLATQYFDQKELERQAGFRGVEPESVVQFERMHQQALENMTGVTRSSEYQVQRGQSISDVASTHFRERNGRAPGEQEVNQFVERIARANNLQPPYRISSGQTLKIPSETATEMASAVTLPVVPHSLLRGPR